MRKIFLLATFLLLTINFTAAQAQTMPIKEMRVGGIGYGCLLEDVKEICGEPLKRETVMRERIHRVTWIYSPNFSVTAQTFVSRDLTPDEDMPVVGFSLKDNSLSTPSGITVGMSYNEVVKLWGRGEPCDFDGRRGFYYTPSNSQKPVTLTFYVDDAYIITAIVCQCAMRNA